MKPDSYFFFANGEDINMHLTLEEKKILTF